MGDRLPRKPKTPKPRPAKTKKPDPPTGGQYVLVAGGLHCPACTNEIVGGIGVECRTRAYGLKTLCQPCIARLAEGLQEGNQ